MALLFGTGCGVGSASPPVVVDGWPVVVLGGRFDFEEVKTDVCNVVRVLVLDFPDSMIEMMDSKADVLGGEEVVAVVEVDEVVWEEKDEVDDRDEADGEPEETDDVDAEADAEADDDNDEVDDEAGDLDAEGEG